MKMLKKLALVSAISAISVSAFAMEAMDDEAMAATTGQDGITILVKPAAMSDATLASYGVTATTRDALDNASAGYYANGDDSSFGLTINQIVIHDNDGWTATHGGTTGTTNNSGALVIGDGTKADSTVLIADGGGIKIDLDMVGDSNGAAADGAAMLNIRITTPRLGIKVGSIGIADSYNKGDDGVDDSSALAIDDGTLGGDDADNSGATDGNANRGRVTIMNGMEIVMGEAVTNIQLGAESQGAMIKLDTQLVGGLSIAGFSLNDTAGVLNGTSTPLGTVITGGGSIYVGSLKMSDAGGSNLTIKANVDVGTASTRTFADDGADTAINTNMATAVTAGVLREAVATNAVAATTLGAGADLSAQYDSYSALKLAAYGADGVSGGGDDGTAAQIADLATVDALYASAPALAGLRAAKFNQLQTGTQGAYNGLVVQLAQLGNSSGADLALNNVRVGDGTASSIGDIQILGLNINGTTLVISGH